MFSSQWDAARAVATEQQWLLSADQARCAGLTPAEIRHALRAGGLSSVYAGVYLFDPDLVTELSWPQWHRAALLAHGSDACLVGWSAVRAAGGEGLPMSDPTIDVAVLDVGSRHRRSPMGERIGEGSDIAPPVVVRQWPVAADEVEVVGGFAIRRLALSIVDAALLLDRAHSLCLFDWALRAGVHTPTSLDDVVAGIKRRPGIVHVREMAALADRRAASPLESRVRLACVDGDLAPDELQYPVMNGAGVVMGYGDLAWLRRRRPLIGEADGHDWHTAARAVLYDRRRSNDFVGRSCDIVRFTWADAMRPIYVQQVVRAALSAA